ncbi:hypothetical protein P3T18_006660 [Paraburkholderia sp. GAS199]|uniref:hypothetical protein n=1 Tax=Paraburkholderia sp. GAS199 TaxID=3035126 RepID=UPI003D1B7FA7
MRQLLIALLTGACFMPSFQAHAQSSAAGPIATSAGTLQFEHADRNFVGKLDDLAFDRFDSRTLTHFDDIGDSGERVKRMLVQTETGPVLYDFRQRPPVIQHIDRRMTVKRVFWQGDEVVMQSSQGWFRFQRGVLTRLQASTTTYH